jgi:hypothetical protein
LNHRSCESVLLIPPPSGPPGPRSSPLSTTHGSKQSSKRFSSANGAKTDQNPLFRLPSPAFPPVRPSCIISFLKSEGGARGNGRFLPARSPARAFDRLCAPRALPEAGCGRRITPPHGHPRCLCNRCKRERGCGRTFVHVQASPAPGLSRTVTSMHGHASCYRAATLCVMGVTRLRRGTAGRQEERLSGERHARARARAQSLRKSASTPLGPSSTRQRRRTRSDASTRT